MGPTERNLRHEEDWDMEKMLLKMARQLNSMDEASLMALWPKYMTRAQQFDGSREWEESTVVLSLIQAVRGKNHLFNANLAEQQESKPDIPHQRREDIRPWRRMDGLSERELARMEEANKPKKPATVLQFRPKD
jgi:hypothetical protein